MYIFLYLRYYLFLLFYFIFIVYIYILEKKKKYNMNNYKNYCYDESIKDACIHVKENPSSHDNNNNNIEHTNKSSNDSSTNIISAKKVSTHEQNVQKGTKNYYLHNNNYPNIIKEEGNIFQLACNKFVNFTLHKRCFVFLSLLIGFLLFILVSIPLYETMIDNKLETSFGTFDNSLKYIRNIYPLSFEIKKAGDILTQSSDKLGNNTNHFINIYKKEKTATLMFFTENNNDENHILDYNILKDIFFLLQYFKQINIIIDQKEIYWNDICKKYDTPLSGTKCFVLGLFTISELTNINYNNIEKWNIFFDNIIKEDTNYIKNFFSQAIYFLPNFLYIPNNFLYKIEESQNMNNIINNIYTNIKGLLFVYTFDDNIENELLDNWYSKLNDYIQLINNNKLSHINIKNPDGTIYTHILKYTKLLNVLTINDKQLQYEEQNSILLGFQSNYLFILLSLLFIFFYININLSTFVTYTKKVVLLICVYLLTFFSLSSTFFIYLIFKLYIMRIFLLNYFVLFFLSVLFCCVNIFYYNQYCRPSTKDSQKKKKNNNNNNDNSDNNDNNTYGNTNKHNYHLSYPIKDSHFETSYYHQATYKSLYFNGILTFVLILIYTVGLFCSYTITKWFCLNTIFSLISLYIYYAFFFNNMFCYLFYLKEKTINNDNHPNDEIKVIDHSKMNDDEDKKEMIIFLNAQQKVNNNNLNNLKENNYSFENNGINWNNDMFKNNDIHTNHNKTIYTKKCITNHFDKMDTFKNNPEYKEHKIYNKQKYKEKTFYIFKKISLLLLLILSFLILYLYIFINNKTNFSIFRYMNKNSNVRMFIEKFEGIASHVIEPAYLVLPETFNYEKEDNLINVVKLIEDLKKEKCIYDPIISWITTFEILKNDCRNLNFFDTHYELDNDPEECINYNLKNVGKKKNKLYLEQLRKQFCKNIDISLCDTFDKIIYNWIHYKNDDIYESHMFQIKTSYKENIDQILPQYHTITPHIFYDNYIKMDENYNIRNSRIGAIFHNYPSSYNKNIETIEKINNIIKNSNIENIYFYSETYVLYQQAMKFLKEFKIMFFFYIFIYIISIYIFNKIGVLIIFPFLLFNSLSMLYCTYFFSINTDAITIILLKITTAISLSNYLYSTLYFKETQNGTPHFDNTIKKSLPYLLFLILYLISFSAGDYISNVVRLYILIHVLLYILYSITIFCMHRIMNK
ncbi:putative membrane protein [Plasmodium gaboni]|uniref:Putative membrane protein n=1 Tax=Plasmodium gaboni TaxID=647221 RepID=A0A151LAS2_9APIC|nr:putative membrane protein [Plasmodium gaboni]KYN96051.1 putative membrane protein [Plasmodium gaboni]